MINLYVKEMGKLSCGVALEGDKILATMFASNEKDSLKGLLGELPYNSIFQVAQQGDALADKVLRAIKATYDGEDISFSFQFDMNRLSNHAQKVLRLTSLIPTGYVTTYGALAKAAGGSPRSVGHVMATNPFAPLVPCHRVVAADMTLGGYGGGLKTKWAILQRENREHEQIVEAELDGKALKLFPVSMLKPPRIR